jgi:hypothetical protein
MFILLMTTSLSLWFPFALDDLFDKDIFLDFFCEGPAMAPTIIITTGKLLCREDIVVLQDGRVSEASSRDLKPPSKSTSHVLCSRQQTIILRE